MKAFLVLVATFAVASSSVVQFSPTLYTAAIPITTQYHAQDGLGQYSYGYSGGPSAKAEYKSLDGVTRGSYSYVDADGELQTVQYTADSANGFQASATNLPKAPIDDKAAPMPVEDTPEVAMAKVEHFAAFREAELRAAEEPSNGDANGNDTEGQDEQTSNGSSHERSGGVSREATSAETESPNGLAGSGERSSEQSQTSSSSQESTNRNGNGNRNTNENGSNGISRLSTNSHSSDLGNSFNGLSSGLSNSLNSGFTDFSGLSLDSINGNSQLSTSALNSLSSLQLNGDFSSSFDSNNGAMRFSEITPATTSQLRPISLTAVRVPSTSYLRVSTPTHGYSIISPTVLTAVPTLRATSSQTISRRLPISLGSTFLTQELQ